MHKNCDGCVDKIIKAGCYTVDNGNCPCGICIVKTMCEKKYECRDCRVYFTGSSSEDGVKIYPERKL